MSKAMNPSINVSDEALDAPEQHASNCGPFCAPCFVSDEALEAPEQQAIPACGGGMCGKVYCNISDDAHAAG